MTDEDERELEPSYAGCSRSTATRCGDRSAASVPAPDLLQLQRLKKRKLQLRDRIAFIEDQITPDIIA